MNPCRRGGATTCSKSFVEHRKNKMHYLQTHEFGFGAVREVNFPVVLAGRLRRLATSSIG